MRNRPLWVVAGVLLTIASGGALMAQLGLLDEGIQFPDGTVQSSAAETPGEFVQGSLDLVIPDMEECWVGNLYAVPAGKRLRIEWMSVEIAEFLGDDFDPVDVDIRTWLGGVKVGHWLGRFDGAVIVGTSFFKTARASAPVNLYSQGNQTVEVRACRNNDTDSTNVLVTFHGQLFNE